MKVYGWEARLILIFAKGSGVHDSAERPLSRWAACNTYNPRRHSRILTVTNYDNLVTMGAEEGLPPYTEPK